MNKSDCNECTCCELRLLLLNELRHSNLFSLLLVTPQVPATSTTQQSARKQTSVEQVRSLEEVVLRHAERASTHVERGRLLGRDLVDVDHRVEVDVRVFFRLRLLLCKNHVTTSRGPNTYNALLTSREKPTFFIVCLGRWLASDVSARIVVGKPDCCLRSCQPTSMNTTFSLKPPLTKLFKILFLFLLLLLLSTLLVLAAEHLVHVNLVQTLRL